MGDFNKWDGDHLILVHVHKDAFYEGRVTTTTTTRPPPLPSPSGLHPSSVSKKQPRPLMVTSQPSDKGFVDDDEDVHSRGEGLAPRDLTVKTPDRKAGEKKQPTTPRSKHSATEQRRRSKINDRAAIHIYSVRRSQPRRESEALALAVASLSASKGKGGHNTGAALDFEINPPLPLPLPLTTPICVTVFGPPKLIDATQSWW